MKRLFILISLLCFLFPEDSCAQQDLEAWHEHGQTFLIWEHSESSPPDTTYDIYISPDPITSIDEAAWAGRVFACNGSNYRLNDYIPDARWKLPTVSGTITVGANQACFVITPHEAGTSYYAVVLTGLTSVGPENTTGPIEETTDPVTCTIQYDDDKVTIYGHWIDGRADYESGRPDYPVMGNEFSNGIGENFAEWKPAGGYPPGILPLNICLHGGMDNLFLSGSLPDIGPYVMPDGYFVSFDDALLSIYPPLSEPINLNTLWFGYFKDYYRFSPVYPTLQDTVINYTIRRIDWEINWLVDNFPIDPAGVSLMGFSMGANGLGLLTQFYPESYSAALAFVPRGSGSIHPAKNILIGFPNQNLPTNIEGNIGIYDAINWLWRLQNIHQVGDDWPYTIIVSGKNDTLAGWGEKPDLYAEIDSAETGFALYWDERTHMNWLPDVHFRYSEHLIPDFLSRFRSNRSFPAFSATDIDLETFGRQPDPGDGDPLNGDPWGTWGGYLEWDPETITDTQDSWAVTMWVVWESIYSCDIPDADTILASVTPRRLQVFQPEPGTVYSWCLERVSGGVVQQGTVVAEPSGEMIIPDLLLIKDFTRLTVEKLTGIGGESSGDENRCFLQQNRPNPFSSNTSVQYGLQTDCSVVLGVYDISGRMVCVLIDEFQTAGNHSVTWDGKDNRGISVNTGLYFIYLKTDDCLIGTETIIMISDTINL